ncbi:MAG: response regulator transcription factor [Bacteroidota bacterium]
MKKLRVTLADDHTLVRKGIANILRTMQCIEVIFEASNGQELIESLVDCKPDLIITDLRMPVLDGFEAIKRIRANDSDIKIMVLSSYCEPRSIAYLIDVGTNAILSKDIEPEELKSAILGVIQNDYYFNDTVKDLIVTDSLRKARLSRPKSDVFLSEREKEVLLLVCDGCTNSQIADQLCLSQRTVEVHRRALINKLKVENTAMLVRYAVENNMLGRSLKPRFYN